MAGMPPTPNAFPDRADEAAQREIARREVARERVVRLLTDRYADDSLTVEQFEAELDRLHALTDARALEQMGDALTTAAWPAAPHAATGPRPQPETVGLPPGAYGWQRGTLVPVRDVSRDENRMLAVMSSTRRVGPWLVSPRLRVWAIMSEAVLDLRDAVLPVGGCEIDIGAVMANVRVLLPRGVQATVDVLPFIGAAHDETMHADLDARHAPRVHIRGSSVMAEVRVLQGDAADLEGAELDAE